MLTGLASQMTCVGCNNNCEVISADLFEAHLQYAMLQYARFCITCLVSFLVKLTDM